MASKEKLFYIVRLDWLAPERDEEFNRFYNQMVMPATLKRPGILRGVRYNVVGQPSYEGWSGPARAYQYLHIYELEDSERAVQSSLLPNEQTKAFQQWPGDRPFTDFITEVRAVYRRVAGELDFPERIYTTRQNWHDPNTVADWDRFWATVILPNALKRPGILRGTRHVLERGPLYNGWDGPSRAYQYFHIYELADDKALEQAMIPVARTQSPREWWREKPLREMLDAVRAVFRRIA